MFYFLPEGAEVPVVCEEQGYEYQVVGLNADAPQELQDAYWAGADGEEIVRQWEPATPDGWLPASKHDSEDGPIAIFVRPIGSATASANPGNSET
jgi:hypothetical protein